MAMTGIVEYKDHAPPGRLLEQQSIEETLESLGVEDRARTNGPVLKLTAPKHATDFRVGACCKNGVPDFRGVPHTPASRVREVTFIQAPPFDVGASCQTPEFFYCRNFQRIRLGDLGTWLAESKAHVPEQSLALPLAQIHPVPATQMFRQDQAIPERGGQAEVPRGLAQITLQAAPVLRLQCAWPAR